MPAKRKDWSAWVSDGVLIASAVVSILITLLDFTGLLDGIPWLNARLPTLILLAVSLLLVANVVERRTRLAHIEKLIEQTANSAALGVQYLDDGTLVVNELQATVRSANEYIMAVGGRSTATVYLDLITARVEEDGLQYYRLLTGDHITHDLHLHLKRLIESPQVRVAWAHSEKYRSFTASEQQTVVVLPTPYRNKFAGIRLPGERNALLHSQYFLETFAKSLPVRTLHGLEILCENCSPAVHERAKLEKLLADEVAPAAGTLTP